MQEKPVKSHVFALLPFTSAPGLPYHDLDPATRREVKQKRAAMFSESVRKENR
jgi:hypothetical protein